MFCVCSPMLAACPVVILLQHQGNVCARPSKPGHRQCLSNGLPENGFLSPKLIDLTLENCWDQEAGRQYSVMSPWQTNAQKRSLRAETAAMCLEKGNSLSSLWHLLAFMDVIRMTIYFASSNIVWWLLSASPLNNSKFCFLPCTQCPQEECEGIYQALPKVVGANEPWIHPSFNSISVKRTALLVIKSQGKHTAKGCTLLWKGSQESLEKDCVKTSLWLFQDGSIYHVFA